MATRHLSDSVALALVPDDPGDQVAADDKEDVDPARRNRPQATGCWLSGRRIDWRLWAGRQLFAWPARLGAAIALAVVSPASTAEVRTELADALERLAREGAFSGAVVILGSDGVRFAQGFGFADPFTGRRFTPDTPVDSASLAKPVTAAAVLMLARDGRIDLDAPVSRYLADYPHPQATVRHLLAHSAGLPVEESLEPLGGKTNEMLLAEISRARSAAALRARNGVRLLQLLLYDARDAHRACQRQGLPAVRARAPRRSCGSDDSACSACRVERPGDRPSARRRTARSSAPTAMRTSSFMARRISAYRRINSPAGAPNGGSRRSNH